MTLRQSIHSAPAKSSELITKLSTTSNQAVKTRESLFAELTSELSQYLELEDQHFLPLLRKYPETKALAAEAVRGNKELRTKLSQLADTPKDDDAFLVGISELKKGLQEHVRDERSELLPAVLKALSDEEAGAIASKFDNAVAESEDAERETNRQDAARQKREVEEAEPLAVAKRAVVRAEKAVGSAGREAAAVVSDTIQRGAASARDGVRRASESVTDKAKEVASSTREALAVYGGSAEQTIGDIRAVSSSSTAARKALPMMVSAWLGWAGKAVTMNVDMTGRLLQCRSLRQVAETQKDFATSTMRSLMEGGIEMLEITQRAAKQSLNPLQSRLEAK